MNVSYALFLLIYLFFSSVWPGSTYGKLKTYEEDLADHVAALESGDYGDAFRMLQEGDELAFQDLW